MSVFGLGLLAALTALVCGPVASASAAPVPVADVDTVRDFQLIVARHSGDCLDVTGASMSAGTPLIQWPCHGNANQQWVLVPSGVGPYFIVGQNSGQCVDVTGGSSSPGAEAIQWPCHGGANQMFDQVFLEDGYVALVAVHSGQCLDVAGASQANGAPVIQWPCHGGANQQWSIG